MEPRRLFLDIVATVNDQLSLATPQVTECHYPQSGTTVHDNSSQLMTIDIDSAVLNTYVQKRIDFYAVSSGRAATFPSDTWVTGVMLDRSSYNPSILYVNRPEDSGQYCTRIWAQALDDYYCTTTDYFACEFREAFA
nr:hypothetical protein BaRGS_024860 [Batillaria attramentaria]